MIVLNGKRMDDRAGLHAELKRKLSLPDYYGNNLDALNDCLSERVERELIVIEHTGDMLEGCQDYALGLLRVFSDNGIQVLLD
jgi:ribonuclease inhibitor